MRNRIAGSLALTLACACCAPAPVNVSASTLVLEPGTFVDAEVRPTAGADLHINLLGRGPGSVTYEIVLATGQVFAEGQLGAAHLERDYGAEELPLRVTLEASSDQPVTVEWELRSRAPLDATWSLPAPRDG